MTDKIVTTDANAESLAVQQLRAERVKSLLAGKRAKWKRKYLAETLKSCIYTYVMVYLLSLHLVEMLFGISREHIIYADYVWLEVLSFLFVSACVSVAVWWSVKRRYEKKVDLWHESSDMDGLDEEVWWEMVPLFPSQHPLVMLFVLGIPIHGLFYHFPQISEAIFLDEATQSWFAAIMGTVFLAVLFGSLLRYCGIPVSKAEETISK